MKKISVIAAALVTSVAFLAPGAASAGCLKGAAVGAVGGHFLHHHGLIGAAAGCAIGHHHHKVKMAKRY
jgi:hypothetical protein